MVNLGRIGDIRCNGKRSAAIGTDFLHGGVDLRLGAGGAYQCRARLG